MKAVIVNCFDTYEDRVDLVHEYLREKCHDVTVIQSSFRHFEKIHRTEGKQDFIFVKSKPYYRNMSVARLFSHYLYAKDAFGIVEEIDPDLIYVIIPPNSLARFAAQYKKRHDSTRLVFDLVDLWPETLPVNRVKSFPPFSVWEWMRDNSLRFSDFVITECDLYQSVLGDVLEGLRTKTVYLAKRDIDVVSVPRFSEYEIHLAYLGSINNIIDIPKIKAIVKAIGEIKPTTLHIIGDGESRRTLIDEVNAAGARVEYHGKVYDPQRKQDVFDICHFGLNIMKDSVCVGLSMKSIDYFQHGLPILNNIQADTRKIVEDYQVGFNVSWHNIDEVSRKITAMNHAQIHRMRANSKGLFDRLFSQKAFTRNMDDIQSQLKL